MNINEKQTWHFKEDIYVEATGTAVGPYESNGPLTESFDKCYDNLYCGEDNWELAERKLMMDAISICLKKANKTEKEINVLLAGDLLNQNVTSNYVARQLKIPYLGTFSACATAMETVAIGASLISGGFSNRVIAATSSHNATAERQFRYPTEFGGQKPDTSTFTVTGAGALLLSKKPTSIKVTHATVGRVIDMGIKNPFNMGTAMVPAALDTIMTHLKDTGRSDSDYDLIVTGDLSIIGSKVLKELLREQGIKLRNNYQDCGVMIFSRDQPVFAGGSGCACPAVVTYGHLLKEMQLGKIRRMLVVATGALMSPTMMQQKESIPCVAHGVVFESEVIDP
ncbi:stage V sporulation protein AD [Alkalihalobacterium alkalinitrilicum]|uniref:stage V sporulation protein AD n=1 Tax=Alkalihalobacterium alkalinitrilicum TaxID=427920 RepID=UPI00099560CF|nr:stage V sporulation protein AD [Alkalihalobacterium alkalinitrilicum]